MLFHGFPDHCVLRVVAEVVVSVSEGKSVLADAYDVVPGVFLVSADVDAEEKVVVLSGAMCEQVLPGLDGVDFGNVCAEWRCSFAVETDRVHHHVVEVTDFLLDAAFLVLACGNVLDEGCKGLDVVILNLSYGSPHRILLWLRVEFSPMSCGISCEIVACADGGVHVGVVDAGVLDRCSRASCR